MLYRRSIMDCFLFRAQNEERKKNKKRKKEELREQLFFI